MRRFRGLRFQCTGHLTRHRVWRSPGEDHCHPVPIPAGGEGGATTRDHVVAVRHLMPSPVEGRKREDTRLRLARTPGVERSLRASARPRHVGRAGCSNRTAPGQRVPGAVCVPRRYL
jgi:hypothetical protein